MPIDIALSTSRLELGAWRLDDAEEALAIYGSPEVARWLSPAMQPVGDVAAMRAAIERWAEIDDEDEPPIGHWTVRRRDTGALVGSVTMRRMPPHRQDLELAWQFAPQHWGQGYAFEAAHAVARWGFERSAHELFAVTRLGNDRAVRLAERLGMQWVGETEKYYDLRLQVFRVRPPELLNTDPGAVPRQRTA